MCNVPSRGCVCSFSQQMVNEHSLNARPRIRPRTQQEREAAEGQRAESRTPPHGRTCAVTGTANLPRRATSDIATRRQVPCGRDHSLSLDCNSDPGGRACRTGGTKSPGRGLLGGSGEEGVAPVAVAEMR